MSRKIRQQLKHFYRFHFIVSFTFMVLFFLFLMIAVLQFKHYEVIVLFLGGWLYGVISAFSISWLQGTSWLKILSAGINHCTMAHLTSKNVSNFISFFYPSCTLITCMLILTVEVPQSIHDTC